jgi:transposase
MSEKASSDEMLNDIRAYLRISAASASKTVATKVFDSQEKALVYQKLGEKKSQGKIEAETGVLQSTVSRWFDEFVEAGLASEPNQSSNAYKALFSLRELGINVAELERRKVRQKKISNPKEKAGDSTPKEDKR